MEETEIEIGEGQHVIDESCIQRTGPMWSAVATSSLVRAKAILGYSAMSPTLRRSCPSRINDRRSQHAR